MRLLVRDRHLEHHPVEPLDLVRVEPLARRPACRTRWSTCSSRGSSRNGEAPSQLGRRHLLDQAHAPAQRREDLAVDLLDALAERLQVAGLRHGGEYSGRENPPPSRGNPVSPPENRFPAREMRFPSRGNLISSPGTLFSRVKNQFSLKLKRVFPGRNPLSGPGNEVSLAGKPHFSRGNEVSLARETVSWGGEGVFPSTVAQEQAAALSRSTPPRSSALSHHDTC